MKYFTRQILWLYALCTMSIAQPSALDLHFTSFKISQEKMVDYCTNVSFYYNTTFGNPEKWDNDYCLSTLQTNGNNGGIRIISLLDTTVEMYFYGDSSHQWINIIRRTQNCIGPYPEDKTTGTSGTHQFSEVFETELLRFQENGVINLPRDSLTKTIKKIVKVMVENNTRCSDMDQSSYDETNGRGGSIIGPGCCSLVNTSSNALPTITFTTASIRATKTGKNKFYILGAEKGSSYTLLDLNGKVLKQGVLLSQIIQTPTLPAVLKIQNQIIMLK